MSYRDPEGQRQAEVRYRARHRDLIRERSRSYREANGPAIRERARLRREANRDRAREQDQRYRHGVHPDGWAALWSEFDGRCYLCGDVLTVASAHIDHDHMCCPAGKSCACCRRGLACGPCNKAIGMAHDDPDRLERIAASLRTAKLAVAGRMASRPVQGVLDV